MLCKLWYFVNVATIKSIYCAIFHSRLSYVCTARGQNLNSKHCINLLQKKAAQIISCASFDAHTLQIFAKLNIVKFPDLISFCNCLFIYKHLLNKYSSAFSNVFILTSFFFFFFLIGICSMQGCTATTRHGVTRKGSTKRLKHINLILMNRILGQHHMVV